MNGVDTKVERPYLYVIGEVGEVSPVKIGWSRAAPATRLGQHQVGTWRRLEYLHLEHVQASHVVAREFRVHLSLDAYWKGGEWFDVRRLAIRHLDGWAGVISDAAADSLPGSPPNSLRSPDGRHELI